MVATAPCVPHRRRQLPRRWHRCRLQREDLRRCHRKDSRPSEQHLPVRVIHPPHPTSGRRQRRYKEIRYKKEHSTKPANNFEISTTDSESKAALPLPASEYASDMSYISCLYLLGVMAKITSRCRLASFQFMGFWYEYVYLAKGQKTLET